MGHRNRYVFIHLLFFFFSKVRSIKILKKMKKGQCISKFTNKKIHYCVKFNPDEDKQNIFVSGCSDKKIVQV